jgi:hypothetical protein
VFRSRDKWRLVRWFFFRSSTPFVVELAVVAPLVLGLDVPSVSLAYVLAGPWLLIVLGMVMLPFLGSAFSAFKMNAATRRNHALEHATIYYLRALGRRCGGHSSSNGFRVSGAVTDHEVRTAFEKVRRRVRAREPFPYISRHCGSNVVTALGFGMFGLFLVLLISVLFRPPLLVRIACLVAAVLVFIGLNHRVGNWIQARFFMLTDFDDVGVRDIRRVPARFDDAFGTVFFVTTAMRSSSEAIRRTE